MNKYTVILLRPDHEWDGPPHDWTWIIQLWAPKVTKAVETAQQQASDAHPGQEPNDYAPLAVYPGYLDNVLHQHEEL